MTKTNTSLRENQVALYVHIPFCKTKCSYCSFYSVAVEYQNIDVYISAVISELDRWQNLHGEVATIYIGGGSPSCLPAEKLKLLISEISRRCPHPVEFTVEVNCGQVDLPKLSMLRTSGVDRLSIGAQSFNRPELDLLGRTHTVEAIEQAVTLSRQAGFKNVSLDLIFAIPASSLASWQYSLNRAIQLNVEHISAYSLSIEHATVLDRRLKQGEIKKINERTDAAMYEMAIDTLAAAGFVQYEISNFAKPGFECRHNLWYWANGPFIGIGPAAASYVKNQRWTNVSDIEQYVKGMETAGDVVAEKTPLTSLEVACETTVLNLRRISGIDLPEFAEKTGYNAEELFAQPIKKYLALGLLAAKENHLFLTRKALPIADSVLCDFSSV